MQYKINHFEVYKSMVLVHSQSWTTAPFSDSRTSSSPSKETSCPVNAHQHIKELIYITYKRTMHFPVKTEKRSKVLIYDTVDAPLDFFLIIIHRECEAFQDPAFAESAWKMVWHGRNSWEPIRMAVRV